MDASHTHLLTGQLFLQNHPSTSGVGLAEKVALCAGWISGALVDLPEILGVYRQEERKKNLFHRCHSITWYHLLPEYWLVPNIQEALNAYMASFFFKIQPAVALPTSLSLSTPQPAAQITVSYPAPRSSQQQTQPQKQRVFTGVVTKLHDTFGFVDEDVFFQLRWVNLWFVYN